ncbi:unnamed protein product [Camellia sinensis]
MHDLQLQKYFSTANIDIALWKFENTKYYCIVMMLLAIVISSTPPNFSGLFQRNFNQRNYLVQTREIQLEKIQFNKYRPVTNLVSVRNFVEHFTSIIWKSCFEIELISKEAVKGWEDRDSLKERESVELEAKRREKRRKKFDIIEVQIGFVLPTVISPCDINLFRKLASCDTDKMDTYCWNTYIVLPFKSKN